LTKQDEDSLIVLAAFQLVASQLLALEALAALLDSLPQLAIEKTAWCWNGERVAFPQSFNFICAVIVCKLF
jgi:hypothetical protein